jgi:methionyl-tRNA formyltransferase
MTTPATKTVRDVLVVSDNPELTEWFQTVIQPILEPRLFKVSYSFSASNATSAEMQRLGANPIQLRDAQVVSRLIETYGTIISMHCKQIFPADLVAGVTCINVHPGYNPYNRGWFPQVFSIVNGLPLGATIHLMDDKIDHGGIIIQDFVKVDPQDTSFDLYRKIISLEKKLLIENIHDILNGEFEITCPPHEGNYNSLSDFRKMCRLDLDHVADLGTHLELLKALSHDPYRNAYYFVKGERYFVKVLIEKE